MKDRTMYLIILSLSVTTTIFATAWYKNETVLSLQFTIRAQSANMTAVAKLVQSVPGWTQGYAQQFRRLGINVPDPPPKKTAKPPTEGTGNGK